MEPAELRPRLFGSGYLRLQSLKDVLLLGEVTLPLLEKKDETDTKGITSCTALFSRWAAERPVLFLTLS